MENQVQPGGDGTPSNNAYTNHLISADGKNKITHLLEVYGGTKEALEALLKEDADNAEKELSSMYWYHGSISREEAEIALGKGGCSDGLYLVRASQSTPGNFAISLAAKGKLHHFQITECGEVYFNIDKGTIFQGLENLINAHKELSHGLPSKLRKFIRKGPPPPSACRYGWTNFLHKAVIEGNAAIVRKILESTLCPDINAKSSAAYHGSAALHDAAYLGHDAIILQLLAKGADVRLRDSNSMTPLHKAAEGNQPNSIKILIEKGKADPHERSLVTGSVPMHIAAKYGHTECLKALLSFGAPCWPRDEDDSTPYQLAERLHHKDAAKLLNEYRSPRPNVHMSDWYHRNLKREAAAELFHNVEAKDGTFLVRDSSKHPHWHVLAVICQGTVFNFEIKNYENHVFSYIDDGPYLESIEHVIEHYSQRADGLPCKLEMAITPAGKLLDIKLLRPKRGGGIKEDLPAPPSLQPPVLPAAVDDRPPPPPQKPPHISAKPPSQEPDYPPPPPPPSVTDLSNVPSPSSPSKGKHLKAFFKKSKKVKEKSPIANPTSEYAEPTSPGEFLLIPYPSMELEREIGQGEFGSVYRGTWKKPNGKKQSVAVKTLHPEIMHTASSKEQFLVEAKVMAKLDHPCIVKLIGVSEGKLLLMVQELVAMGSLLNYLIEYPERIEKSELYLWAAQIACGMMYLETKKFVHRDLAARNILLASVKQIKISDFGLSRAVGVGSDYYQASKGGRWPVKWYAPECVYYGTFSNASDVWSFGVTLWEMFSYGAQPYEEVAAKEVIAQIDAGERLPQPEKCPDKDYETMNKCWQYNAADRPTFDELNARFADDPDYASINDLVIGRKWRES
ncbi:tyrosine-protein kinase HTK16-like isoform X2 [Lineus longissimus]|uniref:tyrosine-protein kinase HTK16-like isoform X2 n=1 Tax=Lineus longissimus TaxID=88925 RepID=UPI00315D3260